MFIKHLHSDILSWIGENQVNLDALHEHIKLSKAMKMTKTNIDYILIIEPHILEHHQGYLTKSFSKNEYEKITPIN